MTGLLIFTAAFSLLLALLHPVTLILSRFSRRAGRGFYTVETTHKGKHWRTMHLTSYDPVGRLSRMQALHFHQCFLAALENALRGFREPLYFRSHLMRPVHLRSMEKCLAAFPERRWRKKRVSISRAEHWGIRLQTLFNEWRWITPQDRGYLIVIGPPGTGDRRIPKAIRSEYTNVFDLTDRNNSLYIRVGSPYALSHGAKKRKSAIRED